MFTRPVLCPDRPLPHLLRRPAQPFSLSPVLGPRSVPWRLRAPQDRAYGGDAIEPSEEVAEEDELSERGGMHSRKWTLTTHPKKEPWSTTLAASLALWDRRGVERRAGGAQLVSQLWTSRRRSGPSAARSGPVAQGWALPLPPALPLQIPPHRRWWASSVPSVSEVWGLESTPRPSCSNVLIVQA